jgi:glycosyltransferase involved in cell wall biosynthesis
LRVLVIDTYYWPLLKDHKLDRTLETPQAKLLALNLVGSLGFGTGSAYVKNLLASGHESRLVVANSAALQLFPSETRNFLSRLSEIFFQFSFVIARAGVVGDFVISKSKFFASIKAEIDSFNPDVVLILDINLFSRPVLRKLVPNSVALVGEIASPLPPKRFIRGYDLIFSAHPGLVREIEKSGVKSKWNPLGVDPEVFPKVPSQGRDIDAVFVGSFGRLQKNTGPLLAEVKRLVPSLRIYGSVSEKTLKKFGLLDNYKGPAWGSKMFDLLSRAKISINRHGEIAGPYAANMRMYESTAAGALLLTEEKSNLKDLFVPGSEVVAYRDNRDAAEKARYYLDHPDELDKIARAGQKRTLSEHTYGKRMERMLGEISKIVSRQGL